MKIIFTIGFFVLLSADIMAQGIFPKSFNAGEITHKKGWTAGIGISLISPAYNLELSAPAGGSVDVMVLYGLSDKFTVTGGIGFTALPGLKNFPSTAVIPVQLGMRYFAHPKIYIGPRAGLGIYTILKQSDHYFSYGLAGGYFVSKKFETGLFYDGFSNNNTSFGYAGIRIGFQF